MVIFTGAGISKESGLSTFRDSDGLWNNYSVEEICTHQAWVRDPEKCVQFYNEIRKTTMAAQPNAAHLALTRLQQAIPTTHIVTQNIDDLHERAGSTHITHLHGEIMKLRSQKSEIATVPITGWEQHYGDKHPDGSLLRPYVVFFGEGVPYFDEACGIAAQADVFVVIGTSLNVYPAAGLLHYVAHDVPIYVVDPGEPKLGEYAQRVTFIQAVATKGVPPLVDKLIQLYHE